MFVTSDVFDLMAIGKGRGFEWRENLLGGVVVHGTRWRGYQAAADYLLRVAERCSLVDELRYASYNRRGDRRQHFIKPTSFGRLACGRLAGAKDANSVLLKGAREAEGSYRDSMLFGGEVTSDPRTDQQGRPLGGYPHAFDANFCFPINDSPSGTGSDILHLAVESLDAEYGYYFVRDDICIPDFYFSSIGASLDFSELASEDNRDSGAWYSYVREAQIWTDPFPLLRDLYEVNLISDRHTSVRTSGLGYIADWISASPGRGRLEDLGRGRLLWTLRDDEMVEVRPVLMEAGLIKSRLPRIYRDLTPGFRREPDLVIRIASPDEARGLRRVGLRAKFSWGYSPESVAVAEAELALAPEKIAEWTVWLVAEGGVVQGMAALRQGPEEGRAELEDFFHERLARGWKVGRELMSTLLEACRVRGVKLLGVDAEPGAEAIYQRFGFATVSRSVSTSIPGRSLPRMEKRFD